MAGPTDVAMRLEAWLADEETAALPPDVLDAVMARLPSVQQMRARPSLPRIGRSAGLGLIAAGLLLGGAVGLAVLVPPPSPSPVPGGSMSPAASGGSASPTSDASPAATPDNRLGVETWKEATRLDLTGWSRPPDGLALAMLAAGYGGELPGTWQLVITTRPDTIMFRAGLIAVLPTQDSNRGPNGVVLVRTYPAIDASDLDAEAERLASEARGDNGEVVDSIRLPAGPARVIRSSFETPTHGTVEVIEYVILTRERLVVLEFGADWRRFDELAGEFLRVATTVTAVRP